MRAKLKIKTKILINNIMILLEIKIVEKYKNGKIKYTETIAEVSNLWIALYPNVRINKDGKLHIRIGENKKYKLNGEIEWELYFDNFGNLIK